jgi:hypothetical protein
VTVAGSTARRRVIARTESPAPARARLSRRKRVAFLLVANLMLFPAYYLVAEVAFRLFWSPRYWIHTDRLMVGSGQSEVGKKWWPNTTYRVDGSEFRTEFRTNALGYRARPKPILANHPNRIAFVGDSFTEAMQVPYEASFCARLERLLNQDARARTKVCINYGVSATDLFDYWHRIVHDVLTDDPPDALVLCIYPGNDFQLTPPADGFQADGRPLRQYFRNPGLVQHLIAWVNLHSKFGFFLQRSLLSWNAAAARPDPRLKNWWSDSQIAARLEDEPAVRRYRSLFRAIDEECRRRGTKLCILVVGPVANYAAKDGQSPLARILARWQIDVPVIDIAIRARARRDWASLVFPFDGHLNETGHDYLTSEAIGPLRESLDGQGLTTQR